jgi:polyferredoxin
MTANSTNPSMSIANPHPARLKPGQKIGAGISAIGALFMVVAWTGYEEMYRWEFLTLSLVLIGGGIVLYSRNKYLPYPPGIKNNGVWFKSLTNRAMWGWLLGLFLTGFYIILYWFPSYLGYHETGNTGLVRFFDPLSFTLKGSAASQWFVYGCLYTAAILFFGVKFILKYRHNRYQVLRTFSVMFFQLGFAFLIPEFLIRLNYPYNDFKDMWPLNYDFFDGYSLLAMTNSGNLGLFMLIFGILMIFIISPVLTYLYGKRWYCSWVCGCGGLAETAGDPFRHLSAKSLKSWKIERWLVHGVLLFSIIMTIAIVYGFFHENPNGFWITKTTFLVILFILFGGGILALYLVKIKRINLDKRAYRIAMGFTIVTLILVLITYYFGQRNFFFIDNYLWRSLYGFLIGATFSGVIGVGFYPLMGSRVWCRFGCPMAAILGIQQRFFSRFRITTNGGQCISCGNCSTYCEMGIDVRSYAQKGQNIVRASCVGCGICAAVCPRGVLRLENGSVDIMTRTEEKKIV